MSRRASLRAQAKVNLFLRVLAREDNGYHQLETLFCRISLSDLVHIMPTSGACSLALTGPALPAGGIGTVEKNLAWRAAELFRDTTGWPYGWSISIEKHIPVGAGLGGGSANAGAVLRALNTLAPTPLATERLLELASRLGADVPFLTQDRTPLAVGWGRGERLLALPPLPSLPCAVHSPPFSVATAQAYEWLADARKKDARTSPRLLAFEQLANWSSVASLAENDFEPVIACKHPGLDGIATQARHRGAMIALLSGSGSALFAIGSSPEDYFPVAMICRTADRVETVELSTE